MKALILRSDAQASVATARTLIDKGFQILSVDTLAVAHALIRVDTIDLLVMDERIEGQLTHAIALSGERRNPYLSAILLTDRKADETDDLFDLIPSLYGLVGAYTAPDLLGKLAVCAVSNIETALARMAENAAAEAAELVGTPEVAPLILADSDMMLFDEDSESDADGYADRAIAAPEMAEIAVAAYDGTWRAEASVAPVRSDVSEKPASLENLEDAVSAEVAALFRKHPILHHTQPQQPITAKAG